VHPEVLDSSSSASQTEDVEFGEFASSSTEGPLNPQSVLEVEPQEDIKIDESADIPNKECEIPAGPGEGDVATETAEAEADSAPVTVPTQPEAVDASAPPSEPVAAVASEVDSTTITQDLQKEGEIVLVEESGAVLEGDTSSAVIRESSPQSEDTCDVIGADIATAPKVDESNPSAPS
jgi:hypothetical protein